VVAADGDLLSTIEHSAAPDGHDPPSYARAVKATGDHTSLFIASRVAHDKNGDPARPLDFPGPFVFRAHRAQVEPAAGRSRTSSRSTHA
jgi:hypothetical protein